MCGICGLVTLDGVLPPQPSFVLRQMNNALRHRGPDGDGVFIDDYAALGHRRLAIIDREGGAQPLTNEDGNVQIVFNGEIYNHRDLQRDLVARGHRFRTHSDTEAIVHAYEEYGPACVDRLEGMFAFAIYDRVKREVFIARDRVGKKPLFYGNFGGVFHFASEMKSLQRSPLWNGEIASEQLEPYLTLGYILAPHTIFRHVRKLEPGHWLIVRDGRIQIEKYWDVDRFDEDRRDPRIIVEELGDTLRNCVQQRLESEVPLGAFLSGGIDSNLVVSYMSEVLGPELLTTSVGFNDAQHNELAAATLSAKHFGTTHHSHVLTPRLEDVLDRLIGAFDEPFADASAIPTFYVSQIARQHVTVALTGDGGDETFGGYALRYRPHAVECYARRFVPGAVGANVLRHAARHWPRSSRLPRPLRLGTILDNLSRSAADAYYADLCILKPNDARWLLGYADTDVREGVAYDAVTAAYTGCTSSNPIQRALYADFKIYLPNDVLVKVDRMSMLNSLEVRSPLLDRRIVELAFAIPADVKMPRLAPKHLLKRLAAQRVPSAILSMPKHGFSAPIGAWMAGPYAKQLSEDLFGRESRVRSLLDVDRLRMWVREHTEGYRDWSNPLWAVWMLERWMRQQEPQSNAEWVEGTDAAMTFAVRQS